MPIIILDSLVEAYDNPNNLVSITAATTLYSNSFGKIHICTGTSADYTVTLPPVAVSKGRSITICIASTATKLITLAGSGAETIDGANLRPMWAGESAEVYCDGVSWYKVGGKSIPMIAGLALAASHDFEVADNTVNLLTGSAKLTSSISTMNDTGNYRVNILRTSKYDCYATALTDNTNTNASVRYAIGFTAGSGQLGEVSNYCFAGSVRTGLQLCLVLSCNSGTYLKMTGQYTAGSHTATVFYPSASSTFFTVTEIPQW